jgi:uncharacterized membrane protein
MHPVKATPLLTLARLLGATLLVLMQLLWAAAALAQATGGSFGGGDFDDGGGGSYGGGSYGGESYGGSYDDDGGRGAGVLFDLVFIAFRIHPLFGLVVLGIGLVVLFSGAASRRRRHHADFVEGAGSYTPPPNLPTLAAPAPDTRAWMGADVTQIRIALEMSARPAFEQALAVLMRTADVRTKHGLLQIVHRVAQLLRENEPSWRLAGETNYHPMSPPQASGVFQQLSTTGRAIAGSATSASADAAGLYFVTLLVAARREIVDFHAHRPEQIRMVLDDLMRLAERDLVAVEAYWLPHEPGLGLSEAELRRLHPDLKPVGEGLRVGTPEGMVFCTHCGQPGPKGSPTCGHCGAPRP